MVTLDEFLTEMKTFSLTRTPIRLRLKTELSQMALCGYISGVSGDTIELQSEAMDAPSFGVTLNCAGLTSIEEKGFDITVLEEFGKLFDELDAEERGRRWAKRFERAWFVRFRSGASFVIEKVAQ